MSGSSRQGKTFRLLQVSLSVLGVGALLAVYQNCSPQLATEDSGSAKTSGTPRSTTCTDCFTTVPNTQPTPTPAPANTVIGYVDGIIAEGDKVYIGGWACASANVSSIDVHVYRGGPAGSGQVLFGAKADRSSEAAVAQQCQASQGAFRFRFDLSLDMRLAFAGQKLYLYGISPVGGNNPELNGSGNFVIPPLNNRAVYRYWRKDHPAHIYSTNLNELTDTNRFSFEGEAFRLFAQASGGMRTVYRCYIPSHDLHFLSTSADCEGQTMEDGMGFASASQSAGAPRALIRCVNATTMDHLVVVGVHDQDAPECVNAQYQIEGVLGYVP